ncbi:hypothetical protein Zm00014a_027400, partial [Zea mays]
GGSEGIKSPPIQNCIGGDLIPSDPPQSTPKRTSPKGVFGYTPLKFSLCPIECLNLRSGY